MPYIELSPTVYAAPFDAMAYNGMQVNGSMDVSQELGPAGSLTMPSGTVTKYIVDGWQVVKTGTSVLTAYQTNSGLAGLPNALQLQATTAQPTIGSDYVRFLTAIEGYRTARLGWGTAAAQSVTVGFWARFTLTGTYRAIAYNFDGSTVSPWMPFTINASLVWQWVTITFAGLTTGTWKTDNNAGMALAIEVASSATPNTVGATGQFAAITGVVVLPGLEAPSAARSPFIMRPVDQELPTCQQYFNAISLGFQQVSGAVNSMVFSFSYPSMRSNPTTVSLPWLDANYVNTTPTTFGSWAMMVPGVTYCSKTAGTFSFSVSSASPTLAVISIMGATVNTAPIALQNGPGVGPFMLNARL